MSILTSGIAATDQVRTRTNWIVPLCLATIIAKIVMLLVLAVNTRFVMDEFWHFAQANYVFNGFFETIWPKKAIGYAVFYKIAHLIGWDAESMLIAGRLLNAMVSFLLLWVVMATTRILGWSRSQALVAGLMLLCFSTFIERTFRLRSEPLAILFAATALLIVMRGSADRAWRLLVAGLFCGLAFITTQKSVYFNVALGTGLVVDAFAVLSLRHALKRSALLLLGWAIVIAGYGLIFGGFNPQPVLHLLFFGPLDVAINGDSYYSGLQEFVWQTLTRNAGLYALCGAGIILTLSRLPVLGSGARIHLVNTVVISALVFTHNQPWPYVFTMALPFMVSYVPRVWERLDSKPILHALLLAVIVVPSFVRNVEYLALGNSEQLRVAALAENLLKPEDTYFDGTGMVPSRKMSPRVWLDAKGVDDVLAVGQDSEVVRVLHEDPPELIIESYRTTALAPLLKDWLSESYVRIADNVLVEGATVPPGETVKLTVLQRRSFTAIQFGTGETQNSLQINGIETSLPVELEPGIYRFGGRHAGSPMIVVPVDKAELPAGAVFQQKNLFSGIYKF